MFKYTYHIILILALLVHTGWGSADVHAQNATQQRLKVNNDSLKQIFQILILWHWLPHTE